MEVLLFWKILVGHVIAEKKAVKKRGFQLSLQFSYEIYFILCMRCFWEAELYLPQKNCVVIVKAMIIHSVAE